MYKFPITEYSRFEDLPLDQLDALKFSVYIVDLDWNYLFVNAAAVNVLGDRGVGLVGQNMWKAFPELATDPVYRLIRRDIENGVRPRVETNSPVTSKRLSITGYALADCYYFAASVIPDRKNLLDELRNELAKKRK